MTTPRAVRPTDTFSPRVNVRDPLAAYWLRQATLRLRREICWLWRERALLAGVTANIGSQGGALLPPFTDRLADVLDRARYDEERAAFFETDETASYLTRLIEAPPAMTDTRPARSTRRRQATVVTSVRGGFTWLAEERSLEPVARFVLALALLPAVDSAAGTVFAACLNDQRQAHPTLALAQRLWDAPEEVFALMDPAHVLHRLGLLDAIGDWDSPLSVPALVARQLLFPESALPNALASLPDATSLDEREVELAVARLKTAPADRAQLLPIYGAPGAPLAGAAARLASALEGDGVQPAPGLRASDVPALATVAWLRGVWLYLPVELLTGGTREGVEGSAPIAPPVAALPTTLFVGVADQTMLKRFPPRNTLPAVRVQPLSYTARLAYWHRSLPTAKRSPALTAAIADCARRFRYETPAIDRIAAALGALDHPPTPTDLYAICRADVDLGDLAQAVAPRFELDDLMLPPKPSRQMQELIGAVRSLTAVHHEWGTARAWNESGLSALFAGAPGTGKTMAAETIASAVGMPLYRIDLSQVVNKYIGETEKNLRRLFDAADAADVILFFDEADALFGKRTEVKDAQDRYANLEISYLLERMERFKGLAILATNRKKDLDEAFLRRLRYVIDFPLPSAKERLRIWRGAIPDEVDASSLDFAFLADRFPLAGGHIRAIVFHACLQSAGNTNGSGNGSAPRRLEMPAVVLAVRREMEKLGRTISLDQFGRWAQSVDE
jgi:hypothetical protein